MDTDDGKEAVADLKSQLGALQIGGGGGDMLIDEHDIVDEKQDIANMTPEDSTDERELEPLADDCMFLNDWCCMVFGRNW